MALKFTSFAELLQIKGDGGVSGDNGRGANKHAGVAVPLAPVLRSPLRPGDGGRGEFTMTGGDDQIQHPCGFQATDPTGPTNPTFFQGTACPSSSEHIGQPLNMDMLNDAWHALDLARGRREFKTAMNSDDFYDGLDDCQDALPTLEPAGGNVEPPAAPADQTVWRASAVDYHSHHFSCPTCIAAGRAVEYGVRCGPGLLLWDAYAEQHPAEVESINCHPPSTLQIQEFHDK